MSCSSSDPDFLRCREMAELVTGYIEGTLAPDVVVRFDEHIALCHDCTAYVETMRTTVALTGRIDPEAVDPRIERKMMDAFRELFDDDKGDDTA
jgi:hypothetical protein